jgi:hypothetical protein
MRAAPVASWVAGSLATDDRSAIIAGTTLTSSSRATRQMGHGSLNVAAGLVVGKLYEIIANNSGASTAIDFNAEL